MLPLETYLLSSKLTLHCAQKLPFLLQFIREQLFLLAEQTLASKGSFSIALSGGKTPTLLFQELAKNTSSWNGWQIFFSDERPVPPESADSNFGTAYRFWLNQVPVSNYFRFYGEAEDLVEEAKRYELEIQKRVPSPSENTPPAFDLILLGMGTDGHTASLFPNTEALTEQKRGVMRNKTPHSSRLTFTFPLINQAKQIWIFVTGTDKADCIQDVFCTYPSHKYPIQQVQPLQGQLHWFLDAEASQKIKGREIQEKCTF